MFLVSCLCCGNIFFFFFLKCVVTFLSLGLVPYLYSPFSPSGRNVPARFYIPSFCGLDSSALSLMYYLKSQLLSALVTLIGPGLFHRDAF